MLGLEVTAPFVYNRCVLLLWNFYKKPEALAQSLEDVRRMKTEKQLRAAEQVMLECFCERYAVMLTMNTPAIKA